MRVALVADIHGNLLALDTVLAEIALEGADQILCLGDLAVLGPQPAEVIDRLRAEAISCVCGNVDVWPVPDHPLDAEPPSSTPAIDLTAWTAARLTAEQSVFLQSLPMTMTVECDRGPLLGFHATSSSLDDIIHAADPAEAGEWGQTTILCCGHTHVQAVWRVGPHLWINPGSVGLPGVGPGSRGLPVNQDVAWAEYALLDIEGDRRSVSLRRLPLDVAALGRICQQSGMPHQSWWRARWAS